MTNEREFRDLPVPLSPDEIRVRGQDLAQKHRAYEAREEESKELRKGLADGLKLARREMMDLARVIRDRAEARPVECEWRRDDKAGVMNLVRLDLGEAVFSRPMTDEERQHKLAGIDGGRRRRADTEE